ncbi:16s rrna processing protein [Liquorilactobacillus ghanensis DSM 18630]|jgi:16S rRNA processing protein RimM|uniref:Ribosome maturation factor RimM n=1 Tax=Liquorilactobacillus ghanensis DSM 18630 TaxID=1423750 RepID=A0A0R1VQ00_9LACO|nr:ribosome maturation factor RimM [Liquorilactobacillus ghanensis]KRM07650.1 16s rrna processing protein [Liquorilactobacillus ghanensis DSM 18630]
MKYFEVGKIVNTHGIKGEVKVTVITDFAKQRFQPGKFIYVQTDTAIPQKLTLKTVRPFKQFYLLSFVEYTDLTAVEALKNAKLLIDETEQTPLAAGDYYYHQIIGLKVVDGQKQILGKIKEILSPGANDVWVVERAGKPDLLLPAIHDVIKKIDLEQNEVEVELLDGLDD